MVDSYIAVITQETIPYGTTLGPLPLSPGSPDSLAVLIWRCVDKIPTSRQILKVTLKEQSLSKETSKTPAWLIHIQAARSPEEQTLEVVAKSGQLYYRAYRDIEAGEELKAWFGADLADLLRIPLLPADATVEGKKQLDCMLCQEKFENPYPMVAHLMYRCQRRDNEFHVVSPVKVRKSGRVKNFDIATLTDMGDGKKDVLDSSPGIVLAINSVNEIQKRKESEQRTLESKENPSKKKMRKSEQEENVLKRPKTIVRSEDVAITVEASESTHESDSTTVFHSHLSAFKITDSQNFGCLNGNDRVTPGERSSSAFKKVDKSRFSQVTTFTPNLNSVTNLLSSSLSHRELIFQGSSSFTPFGYHMTPSANNPISCSLPQAMLSTVPPHPALEAQSGAVEVHMAGAFTHTTKLPTTLSGMSSQQLKMREEIKMLRQSAENGFELNAITGGLRLPALGGMNYSNSKQAAQGLEGLQPKSFPTPLLPFLPPSLAALSFPTQNWCAKCNASFRMTSDLVYHMRSHHKRETDPQRVKREEKLKCHICHESFRERHHLTRHMTSHQ